MNKFIKNTVIIIGILLLFVVIACNIFFTAEMRVSELIDVRYNNLLVIVVSIILAFAIFILGKVSNTFFNTKNKRYIFIGLVMMIFIVMQMSYIYIKKDVPPANDQLTAYDTAVAMKNGKLKEYVENGTTFGSNLSNKIYLERYQQQFTLAFIWSILFKIFNSTSLYIIRYFNLIGNILTFISILLICKELSKKYKVNLNLGVILISTFITLLLLSAFIYGDISGLGFAMLGLYFIIKYTSSKKIRYAVFSAISTSIAYMLRMNFLIFILATLIYLFLDLLNKESKKDILKKILVIVGLILIVFLPSTIVKKCCCKISGLDSNKGFITSGYILMGMNETYIAPGWYNYEIAEESFKNYEKSKLIYKDGIKERLNYMIKNPKYTLKFYLIKICSMWAENAYDGIHINMSIDEVNISDDNITWNEKTSENIRKLTLYQKSLILTIFTLSFIVVLQNRKNFSNELTLLLTIFIGGFLFHILWEAKSRYIIPYIIALIPMATIEINNKKILSNIKEKFQRKDVKNEKSNNNNTSI